MKKLYLVTEEEKTDSIWGSEGEMAYKEVTREELLPNARVLTREQVMKSLLALGDGYAVSREDYEGVCDDLFGKESDDVK